MVTSVIAAQAQAGRTRTRDARMKAAGERRLEMYSSDLRERRCGGLSLKDVVRLTALDPATVRRRGQHATHGDEETDALSTDAVGATFMAWTPAPVVSNQVRRETDRPNMLISQARYSMQLAPNRSGTGAPDLWGKTR